MGALEARMRAVASSAIAELRDSLVELEPRARHTQIGRVVAVADGVAHLAGLPRTFAGELLEVSGVLAMAEDLRGQDVRAVLLGESEEVQAGDTVRRLGQILEVPVGPELIGRVLDPLGRPLDALGSLLSRRHARVDGTPAPLRAREPVRRPLHTGVFAIDTMIPIGHGQRQLIIGDRDTGKTDLAIAILSALDPSVVGVYVAIGRRGADTAANIDSLRTAGFFDHGFVVATDAADPAGLIHVTPYAACTMAEALAGAGRDVVVVYDDMTSHANVHRALALLLGRPVGREAHPADTFFAHARLLERATQLSTADGGGSITALPIVETQSGDLSSYIATNLVSITDGQVRLDAALTAAGIRPAVDIALSVSRVGGRAQPELARTLTGTFKHRFTQFLELESFARFGTRLEPTSQAVVDWGKQVRRLLQQDRNSACSRAETVARLLVAGVPALAQIATHDPAGVQRMVEATLASPGFDAAAIDKGALGKRAIPRLREVAAAATAAAMAGDL